MTPETSRPAQPERFLIYGPTTLMDGVGRFNTELVRGLVEGGHEVKILTTPPSVGLEGAANIELPRPPDGLSGLAKWEGFALSHVVQTLDETLRANEGWSPTTILVNGKFRDVGPRIRDLFPEARLAQIAHNLSYYTEHPPIDDTWAVPAFQRGFSRTLASTDMGIGVGPLLTSDLLRMAPQNTALEASPPIAASPRGDAQRRQRLEERRREAGKPIRFLLYGRLDDPNKGTEVAVDGVKRLRKGGYGNAHLTLLGVPGEEIPRYQAQMDRRLGPGVVECKPYASSTQEVQRERDRADVVLMPSIREHFGLVATEALGEGVPLLAPEGAGATLFFTDEDRFPQDLTQGFIVHDEAHCRGELGEAPPPDTPRSALWAEAMADMIDNYPERLSQGTVLRDQYLAGRYTNLHMANAIVEATRELDEGHAKQGETGRLLPAQASRVLPVSAGPTLEALERPRGRQDMHHQALKSEDVITEAGQAVRLAQQGLSGPGRQARAVPHTPRRDHPRRGSERGPER